MVVPLPLSNDEVRAAAEKYGTPLQLYDERLIRENTRSLIDTFRNAGFADFKQFFAVKALPNPAILRMLIQEGCGLDCSSTSELYIAKQLNVPGDQVIYTSNYTSKDDLALAYDMGVIMNLDDLSLVQALVDVRGQCPELMCFRLNPGLGRTDSETKSNVLGGPDAKFGIPPFQIVEAYRQAQAHGATRFGIHMMTGSCVMNTGYWRETVTVLMQTIATLKHELDIDIEFMNIGGGLGIPYKPEEKAIDLQDTVAQIKDALQEANVENIPLPKLCMENGRYITGPFGWLISRCQAIKDTYQLYYGLDASMAHLMRPGMYQAYHHISVVPGADENEKDNKHQGEEAQGNSGDEQREANVVGNLCENNDWFGAKRMLPKSKVGDLFVIYDTGAHSHSMGFQYNGKLRAPELLIRQTPDTDTASAGSPVHHPLSLIRDREVVESLYNQCHVPSDL